MTPKDLKRIKRQLVTWGYPRHLVEKMQLVRLFNCYQNEKEFQKYQETKEKEHFLKKY
ncbi:MAG: hypothetical protein ACOY46_16265 [Bacillota bacterium]